MLAFVFVVVICVVIWMLLDAINNVRNESKQKRQLVHNMDKLLEDHEALHKEEPMTPGLQKWADYRSSHPKRS